ncbi:MAG: hypothetical protein J6Q84_01010 [Kiritimatiellae bacterium]|nr:hypothetical protein [Kiritimatiellia bacterium]
MKRSLIKKAVFAAIGAFFSITALANVAKIGDTEYPTLQDALTAAATTADVEVTLIADTTENITVPAGFTGTIDLGGKTLTGNVQATGEESKKIVATIENGSIVVQESKDAIIINANSVVTLAVNVTGSLRHIIRVNADGRCIVNSGIYTLIKDGAGVNILYLAGARAQMTVNGGTFIGQAGLKGGDIYAVQMLGADSKMYINGGDFVGSYGKLFVKTAGSIEIKGGKFFKSTGSNKNDFNPEKFGLVEGYLADTTINPGYYTVAKAYNVAKTIDAAKVTVTGLNDAYACGGKASFTVAANEGFKVTGVTLDGAALTVDENGKYTFTMPEKDVAIVVTTEVASTFDVMINGQPVADADALKDEAKAGTEMTVPETSTWTVEGNVLMKDGAVYVEFADYYTLVINGTTVTLELNKPVIGDSTEGAGDAFKVTAEEVTIKITNYNSALKYGVRSAADISGLSTAAIAPVTPTAGVITLEKAAGDSAFYEVVVSDVDFPVAE